MPSEHEALERYSAIDLERCKLQDGELIFSRAGAFERALAQGFFLLQMPEGIKPAVGDQFAAHFFEDKKGDDLDRYRGYREVEIPGSYQGYFDRAHDQWENLYIEQSNWLLLPADIAELGRCMADLGIQVLRAVFRQLEIPEGTWDLISSGLSENQGHQMLAFNHFRSDKATRGCKFHRDSGWVTVLRSTEPGLLGLIEGELGTINPVESYFIVNFGSSMEVLTADLPTPVRANIHGVVATERAAPQPDRVSYVTFLDSSLDGDIYSLDSAGTPHRIQSVADFATQEVSRTYDDDLNL
ncbi:2OG-Fe(II) oxygenase family protein [Williamsia herbipolensis]|uniref:2OG-Fe(II) oxygenase family protein n=1 Tax=Williamsia herbipolensis TaxID=1603258 RepID=UPI0005F8702B|nr:2OG-Fe(II) oxygenase family protein [Williamsia herbipolensis]